MVEKDREASKMSHAQLPGKIADHSHILVNLTDLMSTYRIQGRWKEAGELNVYVVETRKRLLMEEHPDTLNTTDNLAFQKGEGGSNASPPVTSSGVQSRHSSRLASLGPSTPNSMWDMISHYQESETSSAVMVGTPSSNACSLHLEWDEQADGMFALRRPQIFTANIGSSM
jgi:hypothetical protein